MPTGSSVPPRNVLKMFNGVESLLNKHYSPQEQRCLKSATSCSFQPVKWADHADRSLWFGLAALAGPQLPLSFPFMPLPQVHLNLMTVPWRREMEDWGVQEWAWFLLLAMDNFSEALPKVHTHQRQGEAAYYEG